MIGTESDVLRHVAAPLEWPSIIIFVPLPRFCETVAHFLIKILLDSPSRVLRRDRIHLPFRLASFPPTDPRNEPATQPATLLGDRVNVRVRVGTHAC